MFDLTNRVAAVTGGASGIGEAVCRQLAASGAIVALLDIDMDAAQRVQSEIAATGGRCTAFPCDVTDYARMQAVCATIHAWRGTIDVFVNNAAVSHIGTVESTSEEEFDEIYRVNVKGVFNGMKALLPYMTEQGDGCIINLASVASDRGIPERFAYSMSKGAVSAMTRSVAVDNLQTGGPVQLHCAGAGTHAVCRRLPEAALSGARARSV